MILAGEALFGEVASAQRRHGGAARVSPAVGCGSPLASSRTSLSDIIGGSIGCCATSATTQARKVTGLSMALGFFLGKRRDRF